MSESRTEVNQGIFDAALEIAARRANTLRQVKGLLENDEDRKALKLLREFFGMKKKRSSDNAITFPSPAPERNR